MKKTISTQNLIKKLKTQYQVKRDIEEYYIKEGRKEDASKKRDERFVIWNLASDILGLEMGEAWDLLEGASK